MRIVSINASTTTTNGDTPRVPDFGRYKRGLPEDFNVVEEKKDVIRKHHFSNNSLSPHLILVIQSV